MKNYKRLTNNNLEEYNPEYDFCVGCKYFGEPNGCNRPNGTCGNYDRFIETYNRLAELEDKIENGTLIELPCKVGDMLYKVVENSIVEYRVHKIEFYITEDKRFGYCLYCDSYALGEFDYFYKKSIGKDVFLTKAEAEERIKGLKEV